MKTYHSQAIFGQYLRELVSNEVRLEQIPQRIHANKVCEIGIVAVPTQFPLADLLLPQIGEVLVSKLAEGQCPHTGICLSRVLPDNRPNFAAVHLSDDSGKNADCTLLKVNGRPA